MGARIVTASHDPANINGLKMDDRRSAAHARRRLRLATRGRRARRLKILPAAHANRDRSTFPSTTWRIYRKLGSMPWDAQLHIVIDPMHGCWAGKAQAISACHLPPMPDFGHQRYARSHLRRPNARLFPFASSCTTCATPFTASGRIWGLHSTATETALPWWIIRAWL